MIETLQRPAPEQADFAGQPAVAADLRVRGDHAVRLALGTQHPRPDVRLVEPQLEDCLVELAARFKRLEQRRERVHDDGGDANVSIDIGRDEPVLERP